MRHLFPTRLILIVAFILMVTPTLTMAVGEPRVRLSAEMTSLAVGQEMLFELRAEDVSPTIKAEAHLSFDPAVVRVVAINHGDFLSSDVETSAFVLENTFDNEAGTLDYTVLLRPEHPAAEGTGLLATITFQALTEDVAPIIIQDAFFFDQNGGKVVAETIGAEISAVGEAVTEVTMPVQEVVLAEEVSTALTETPVENAPGDIAVEAPATESQTVIDTTEIDEAVTVTESSGVVESQENLMVIPQSNSVEEAPRRISSPTETGRSDSNLFLIVVLGVGLTVFALSLLGLLGLIGGWFWLARLKHR